MIAENPNQSGEYDVVLGSQTPLPVDGAVLGGLEGVKQRLARESVEQKIDALLDAFQYGQEGLELVIQALESKFEEVQGAAYLLLQDSTEPKVRLALEAYNPYLFFECLCTIQAYPDRGYKVGSVAVNSDRHTLGSCDCNGMIKVCNLHTQKIFSTLKIEGIYEGVGTRDCKVAIKSDEQIIGVAAFKNSAEIWDVKTGQKIFTTALWWEILCSVIISLNGQTFTSTGVDKNCFYLWNTQTGDLIFCLEEIVDYHLCLDFIYSDAQTLVTRHKNEINSNIIHLWDWHTKQITYTFNMHSHCPDSAVISLDRRFLLSASKESETIIVWSLKTGKELSTLTGHSSSIWSLSLSLDGQTLVSGNQHGKVKVWGVPIH